MSGVKEFYGLVDRRNEVIDAAPSNPLPTTDRMRELAAVLHPAKQFLKVRSIVEHRDAKSYVLEPDPAKGTRRIAPFPAGQYLSVELNVGGSAVTRPYSISSGPLESVKAGAYTITVKRSNDGFVSNYILDNWGIGSAVCTSAPLGTFGYEQVRDAKHVIGIAGGSGITPFRSMASSIADGYDDYSLTILYGSRTPEDILFREDFDEFQKRTDKIRVVHVLSDVELEGYEHGFISAGLIARYLPEQPPFSFFICGPKGLYDFIGGQLETFHMPQKYIRYELFGEQKPGVEELGGSTEAEFTLTVDVRGSSLRIPAKSGESLLTAMERAGIAAPSHCRSGECGYCRSRLVSGNVYIPDVTDGRRLADKKFGFIHPCCTYPLGDVEIDVPVKAERIL